MDHENILTKGALRSIKNNETVKNPVLQVIDIKQIKNTISGNYGYRLTISDGQYFHTNVLLSNQLTNMVTNGYLTQFSIIYIRKYVVGNVKNRSNGNRKVILLTDLVFLIGKTEIFT